MSAKTQNTRKLAGVAMLSAVGFILMFIELSVPIMPAFIKLDFSELPALLASFAYGPMAGATVCLLKNVIHVFIGGFFVCNVRFQHFALIYICRFE